MGISLQDAVERAKLSNDNEGYLSQYMYSNLLSSLDQTEQHAFAMALVDSGVQVKTSSIDEEFSSREIFALMKTQADQFKQSPSGLWVPDSYEKPEEKPQEDIPERNIKPLDKDPDKTPEKSPEIPQDDSEFESQDIQESTQNLIIAFDVDFGQNPENDKFLNFLPLDQADNQSQVGGANVFYFSNIPKDSKITNALDNLGKYAGDSFYAIRTDNSTGKETAYGKRSELMPEDRVVQDSDIVDEEPLNKPVEKAPEGKKTPENLSQGSPTPLMEDKPKVAPEPKRTPENLSQGTPKPLMDNKGKPGPAKQSPKEVIPGAPTPLIPDNGVSKQAPVKKAPAKGKGKSPVVPQQEINQEPPGASVEPTQAVPQAPVEAPVEQPSNTPAEPPEYSGAQPPPLPKSQQPEEESSDEFADTTSVEYIQEVLEKNGLHVDENGKVSLYSTNVPGVYLEKGDVPGGQGGKKNSMPLDKAVQYYNQQVNSTGKEQQQVSSLQDIFTNIKNLKDEVAKFSYSEKSRDPFISELGKYLKEFRGNLDKFEVGDMIKKLDTYGQKQYDRNSDMAEVFDVLTTLNQLKKEDPKKFQQAIEGLGAL